MKAKINYRSKKTIIIISVAVVLLIAAIVGTVAFVKGNQDAAAAMTDDGTSTSQNDGANAGLPNNGDQNNGDDQNNNGTTLPEVGDNTNPADSNNNGNNGSTTNGGTTGTNGANGSNTGANAGTTTGTTTTGNNGANVPNQDYTQTTVIPGRDNVLVEQNTEIGWSPISVAAYTAASKLKVHKPDLDLQKYAYLDGDSLEELPVNTAVQKGETITYVIKITNNGNEDANGIRTIDSIPEGTELASISEGGALNNDGKIVWKNDIKAGETVTVSFKVVVTADSIDLINNIAKVNGEETPETKTPVITANKTAQVVTIVDKEEVLENRDAKVGETIRYTITAKNTTEVDGTTVIKDSIPDGTSFVDGTITEKGNFDKENGTITWNNVVVPAKGEVSVSFDVVVNEKTIAGKVVKSVSNTATIGNTSTEEVETKVANITGEKEVSDKVANVGDTLTYTIILTNNGNGDGKVTVTDAIPKGTKIKVATTDGYDLETNTMTWKNVEVKAGKSVELTLEVVVEDNISIIKNIAYVDGNKIPEEPETTVKHHYTVEHYTENLDGRYSKVEKDTVVSADVEIGTKVTYEANKYDGFTFDDSKTENKDATVPDNNNLVVKLYYTRNSYSYTIKYVEEGNETNILKTTTGEAKYEEEIDVTKETFEGYTYVRQDKEKIKIDTTNNIATVYYTRNSYNVTYEYEGEFPTGASELPAKATYKYGESVTVAEDATAPGYTFSGWDKDDFTMPANDVVIKGSFKANDDTQYKVEHYLEDLDGKTFTLKETETLAGKTDTTATAKPKQYPGFTFDSTVEGTKTSGTITGDGQLVLKLYYTRNSYNVTYEYEGEFPTGASELPAKATYKYGESVTVAEDATAPGYTFSGWNHEDFTMPANDVVSKGSFKANDDTQYKVEHYLEDLDGKTFTLKDTETLAGTTDTTATATPKQYPGFTFNENVDGTKTSGTITGDGQLVLKLYYTRNTYKYTVHYFYNGVEDENKAEEFEALYEQKINKYTIKNQGRYTEYNKESSNRTKEALLVIGTGSNYINVYYGTPNVTISKNVNKTAVKVGDTLHYTIKVTETRGFVDASGVNVTDTIPEGLENIRNITQNGVVKDSKIEWNNLAITKNSSITLEFDATVSATTIGKTISNTANLGGTTSGDSNTVTTTVSELKAAVKEIKKGTTGKDAVNVVLVMDLSYSMQEKKTTDNVTRLEAAKTAATKFINSIYTKDPESKVTVTVLTFNTANPLTTIKYVGTERCTNNNIWHLHLNCKNIDGVWYSKWEEQKVAIPYSGTSKLGFADKTNYGALVNEINNISLPDENPDGGLGTNVSAALDLTKTTIGDLKDNHSENSNVVILLSDGAPTTSYSGNSSSNNYEGLRNQASEIKGNPITTEFYSIQFGTEKGAEKLLKAMSSNNTVYTSNSIDSLVENFTNILDQNTTKDPIDTVNGKYTTTLSNPLVVDADNPITVTYKGTTLFTCTSLPNNGLTYDSTTKTLTWDINAWNAVEGHTKVTTNDIVIQCYVER